MKNLLLLLLLILLPRILFAAVQQDPNPTVVLQSGLTDSFVEEVEQTIEVLINSLHYYSVNGEFHWDEPIRGTIAEHVEEQFSGMDLAMVSETVRSSIYRVDENTYEVRNIYFRKTSEEKILELAVRFDQFGNFSNLLFVDKIYSMAPFAGYNRVIESDDLNNFIQHLEEKYNSRDVNEVVSMFADDAMILAGSIQNDQRVLYRLDTFGQHTNMLRYVYNVNDDIDIRFSDMTFYAHPFDDQLFGVHIQQDWQTTMNSDEGYLFLILERNGESYHVHFRSWQPEPISPDLYPQIEIKKEATMEWVKLPPRYLGNQSVKSLPSNWEFVNYDEFVIEEESRWNRRTLWIIGGAAVVVTGAAILLSGDDSEVPVIPIPPAGGN